MLIWRAQIGIWFNYMQTLTKLTRIGKRQVRFNCMPEIFKSVELLRYSVGMRVFGVNRLRILNLVLRCLGGVHFLFKILVELPNNQGTAQLVSNINIIITDHDYEGCKSSLRVRRRIVHRSIRRRKSREWGNIRFGLSGWFFIMFCDFSHNPKGFLCLYSEQARHPGE